MNTRLENLVLSGLVALAVSVSVSGATTKPLAAPSPPSNSDRVAALVKRVDAVTNREAGDRTTIHVLTTALQSDEDAINNQATLLECLTGSVWITPDDNGNWVISDGSEAQAQSIATIDPSCTDGGSS